MNIILYTKTDCPWSGEIKDLFKKKGVKYEERNMTEHKEFFDEAMKKTGMAKSPTIDIDGEITADTDVEAVRKILIAKKYPGFAS